MGIKITVNDLNNISKMKNIVNSLSDGDLAEEIISVGLKLSIYDELYKDYSDILNDEYKKRSEERYLNSDEYKLRRLLWLRHGCKFSYLYGDDGEMQCNHCMIDFKRMSVEEIERLLERK